jgi:Asp-tRNA(Asn)/Glu-tRNA(Gln) amidotransferase A subunit family amidase
MNSEDLCLTPATDLSVAIRARKLSPVEIVEAILARIDALNPRLNAYLAVDAERAVDNARDAETAIMRGLPLGPLHGLPVSIKDLEPTAGLRYTCGSKIYADQVADVDGIISERVKAAGGIILGKTNTPHFGHKDTTYTPMLSNPAWSK